MDNRYKTALIAYSGLLICFTLFIFVISLGLKEDSKLLPVHYAILAFVIFNILVLSFFPISRNLLRIVAGIMGILCLTSNLLWVIYFLYDTFFIEGIAGRLAGVFIIIIFGSIDLLLLKEILFKIKISKTKPLL